LKQIVEKGVERVSVDPVTFEVLRNRLMAISEEMSINLQAVSGSPIVVEAADFNVGIFSANGNLVTMGKTVIAHTGSLVKMLEHIIADCSLDPGIEEGDMFVVNSPYKGALHAPDMGVLAPIFYEGERIGWAGACLHQLDVGGMVFGSLASSATEVYQESMIIPPVKIIERGKLRTDVWNMISGMSRLPKNFTLDFRAMTSANKVAIKQVLQLVDRYSLPTINTVFEDIIQLTKDKIALLLRQLPDGVYRARNYLDHDGQSNRLYHIALSLTKKSDKLTFDFSESSEQTPGFANCTESALVGGIFSGLLPLLAYDIPWNDGVLDPVEIIAPEGIICNAKWPAAVGHATLSVMWLVESLVVEAISKMLASSDQYLSEAHSSYFGGADLLNVAGLNQYKEPFGNTFTEQMASGAGAYDHRDGIDAGGCHHIPAQKIPNVETMESSTPVLYLYRRYMEDTAGAGRNRGGMSLGSAFVVHDTPSLMGIPMAHGLEVPNAFGLWGGKPGSCIVRSMYRETNIQNKFAAQEWVADPSQLNAKKESLSAKPGPIFFQPGDVFEWSWQGGGGWGDSIDREPERVLNDVNNGVYQKETAENLFKVVISEGQINQEATQKAREEKRRERMTYEVAKFLPSSLQNDNRIVLGPIGDTLERVQVSNTVYVQCGCKQLLAPANENIKEYLGVKAIAAEDIGTRVKLHEELEMHEYACPSCGLAHFTEVKRKGTAPLHDIKLVDY
jgi:N-methylhydantoinase B